MTVTTPEHRRIATAFGACLKKLRNAAGMTQEALALNADMDRAYPSMLERAN
jgi:transcriptional regulator with XRE-family HTH domain